jgi:WhiB family redox-sensing transcriptional regulator
MDFSQAACTEEDTDIFFPENGDVKGKTELAKAICASCPIAVQCLQFAIANEELGIWGGTTAEERKRFKRRPFNVTQR